MTVFSDVVVAAVCRHLDTDHAADVLRLAQVVRPEATAARASSVDADGLTLLAETPSGEWTVRWGFSSPARERADLRARIVELVERLPR